MNIKLLNFSIDSIKPLFILQDSLNPSCQIFTLFYPWITNYHIMILNPNHTPPLNNPPSARLYNLITLSQLCHSYFKKVLGFWKVVFSLSGKNKLSLFLPINCFNDMLEEIASGKRMAEWPNADNW